MQVIGFILSLFSFLALGLTLLPLLGALNWLNIPFAGLGLLFSIIGVAAARRGRGIGIAGIVLSLIAIVMGLVRLFIGGGIF
jgi:hypothetical protein